MSKNTTIAVVIYIITFSIAFILIFSKSHEDLEKKKIEAAKAEMTKRENKEFNQWLEKDKEAQKKLWGN